MALFARHVAPFLLFALRADHVVLPFLALVLGLLALGAQAVGALALLGAACEVLGSEVLLLGFDFLLHAPQLFDGDTSLSEVAHNDLFVSAFLFLLKDVVDDLVVSHGLGHRGQVDGERREDNEE